MRSIVLTLLRATVAACRVSAVLFIRNGAASLDGVASGLARDW